VTQGRRYGEWLGGTAPVGEAVAPLGNLGSFRQGWPDGAEEEEWKTEQEIQFASSFAITYPNNVLTINVLRDAGLYSDR